MIGQLVIDATFIDLCVEVGSALPISGLALANRNGGQARSRGVGRGAGGDTRHAEDKIGEEVQLVGAVGWCSYLLLWFEDQIFILSLLHSRDCYINIIRSFEQTCFGHEVNFKRLRMF